MAIMDALLVFSDEQALTATASSEGTVDLGAGEDGFGTTLAKPELAEGKPCWINVQVGAIALDSSGESATLTVSLYTSTDDSSFSAHSVLANAVAEASLVAGYRIASVPIPAGLSRYNKLYYTVGVESFTSGTITAWIGLEPIVVV
jgi:hypothetical protein